jgi:hypothetical protein
MAARFAAAPVPSGPRAYRSQLRVLGPFVAVAPPTVLGLLALVLLHGNHSLGRGAAGFAAAVLAAPGLLVAGAPLASGGGGYVLAVLASAVAWLLLGGLAAARATRSPVATWREYWRELAWMLAGVWLGVLFAALLVNFSLGNPLL